MHMRAGRKQTIIDITIFGRFSVAPLQLLSKPDHAHGKSQLGIDSYGCYVHPRLDYYF